MVDLRLHTESRLAEKEPTLEREEGILYRIDLPNKPDYWAKLWYRVHNKGLTFAREIGGSLLSPFWAELKVLEFELAKYISPEHIPTAIGHYDQRVKEEDNFNITNGRPVSMTEHIEGDPSTMEEISEINERYYQIAATRKRLQIASGIPTDAYTDIASAHNSEIVAVIGEEINWGEVMRKIDDLENKKLKFNKVTNVIPSLIDAGVYPIHPEANFIPRPKDQVRLAPHGTFVEIRIYDNQKLARALDRKGITTKERSKIAEKFKEFQVLQILDQIYDECFVRLESLTGDSAYDNLIRTDVEIQTLFRNLLLRIRKKASEHPNDLFRNYSAISAKLIACIKKRNPEELKKMLRTGII